MTNKSNLLYADNSDERQRLLREVEQTSDWIIRIRELKRREVISLLRNPTNPSLSYLLYLDGKFQGDYSSKRKLSVESVIMGDYLVFEADISRKIIRLLFADIPVADGPEYAISISVTLKIDITSPQLLVDKGIWSLKDEISVRIEDVARRISGNYKGAARAEAEADLKRHIEAETFDDGFHIVEAAVRRDIPAWVNQLRAEAASQRKRQEEKKETEARQRREEARKRREAQERKREEAEARKRKLKEAQRQRALEQEERQRLKKEIAQRQKRYQDLYETAGIAGLKSAAEAELDTDLRSELEAFIDLMIKQEEKDLKTRREEEDRQRATYVEDRDYERRTEVEDREWKSQKEHEKSFEELIEELENRENRVEKFDENGRYLDYDKDRSDAPVVRFSAYCPREAQANNRYELIVYAHTDALSQIVQADVQKFQEGLGGEIPKPSRSKKPATLELGTPITVVPECADVEFEPQNLTKKWHGDWTRFEFEFRPTEDLVDDILFVRTSVQVAGIEIAHIKSAIEIVEAEEGSEDTVSPQQATTINPLLESKIKSQTVTPYQRIFISYSRRDSTVAKSYKIAQTALGNDAFLDVDNLRAGEDWRAALARAIDEADIFQLFWSEHSASSEYCRYEWDYALKVRCPDDNCEGFIRPVYWREPMPSPPSELSRINFRFVPFEDQDD